jgi:CDP-paratose 2-epimerase
VAIAMKAPNAVGGRTLDQLPKQVGFVEWFHFMDHEGVEAALEVLIRLGVRHLRTAVSWADFVRPDGERWYDWLFATFRRAGLEMLPDFLYTPPSLGRIPYTSAPPVRLRDYADFVDIAITRYGDCLDYVELWNEPTNWVEWDRTSDPEWRLLGEMLGNAAYWAHKRGKKTVLGGLIPVDIRFLVQMERSGALRHFDVVGIHGFPGTWEGLEDAAAAQWRGWHEELDLAERLLARLGRAPELWVTEAGSSTAHQPAETQVARFCEAYSLSVPRLYWYGVRDLDRRRSTINFVNLGETADANPHHYHLGLVGKPLYEFLLANRHIFAR